MRLLKVAVLVGGLLATPIGARAADGWDLKFAGPESAEFVISDLYGTPYVSDYYVPGLEVYGSVPTAVSPYWRETLPAVPANDLANRLLSSVTLTSTGGQIAIFPSFSYIGYYDGEINLTLNFSYAVPQFVGSNIEDEPITGSFRYTYYVNAAGYGSDHDFSGGGGGLLTSVSAHVPEPATWAMLLAGFVAVGGFLRSARPPTAAPPSTHGAHLGHPLS